MNPGEAGQEVTRMEDQPSIRDVPRRRRAGGRGRLARCLPACETESFHGPVAELYHASNPALMIY